jgi:putative transposase
MPGTPSVGHGQGRAVDELCVAQVESWFAQLTNQAIRRGSFAGVGDLVVAIHRFIETYNQEPKPFVWTASVESILEKVNRCRAISRTVH